MLYKNPYVKFDAFSRRNGLFFPQKQGVKKRNFKAWHQKIAIVIRMKFLNDIIKSRHGFKTAQKFLGFR